MDTKIKTGQSQKQKVKNDRIRTPCVRFETSKFRIAKGNLATGILQVSFFFKKEFEFVEQYAIIESKKETLLFRNPNECSNLFGHDVT